MLYTRNGLASFQALVQAALVLHAAAVAPVSSSAISKHAKPTTRIQLEPSGALIRDRARHSSKDAHLDARLPALRREAADESGETIARPRSMAEPVIALEQEVPTHEVQHTQQKALSRWFDSSWMPGPVPTRQQPAFAAAFFMLFGALGFLAYYLYLTWKPAKVDEEALRQRVMRMREQMGAVATEGKSSRHLGLGQKGSTLAEQSAPPDKGFGKGKGKALEKGAGKDGRDSAKGVGKAGKAAEKGAWKGSPEEAEALEILKRAEIAASRQPRRPIPVGAAGLGIGQRSRGPGSVSSVSSSQHSGFSGSASRMLEASSVASTRTSESQRAEGYDVRKASSGKGSGGKVQDVISMLRSVGLIQAAWRQWKSSQKIPAPGQRITVMCNVLEGMDMPNVNRFGGCDPYIECRIVLGDPALRLRGDLDMAPMRAAQTEVKRNDMAPTWEQRLMLPDLSYCKDLYVQLVLWDYNLSRSQPVGHVALPLGHALLSHGLRRPVRAMQFLPLLGGEISDLKAKVSAQFSFWETCKHKLVIASGAWLPKVKMVGTISSYVEARVLRGDPRKASFYSRPSGPCQCLWSGRTRVVDENVDPVWEQEFEFTLACDLNSLWLQLLLWDTNATLPDVPVAHAVLDMSQAIRERPQHGGPGTLVKHTLTLEDLPDHSGVVSDLSRAKLVVHMGYQTLLSADQDVCESSSCEQRHWNC